MSCLKPEPEYERIPSRYRHNLYYKVPTIVAFMIARLYSKVFGAIVGGVADAIGFPVGSGAEVDLEGTVMPYLTAFADFREGVRTIAREHKGESELCRTSRNVTS